ncbi:hypothetical protein SO802_027898 [Lithocarpus litseifolius]|uniref:Glycosyltransferase N-terminal domain-containing protein n=1 Tax=Lithocarpus litseifolius TaxID=425828 RepID=A0AAW2BRV9_9ROSI
MANGREERNIVMFPFMAAGHLNPFMALARQLERKESYTVTIVSTPLNIQRLKSSLPSKTNIRLAEIPFQGTNYGLPPDIENTDTVSLELVIRLMEASENLESPFKSLLIDISKHNGCAPMCIISDMFLGWTVKVANELGIYHAVFIAGAGYSMAIYFSLSLNVHQFQTDDQEFLLPDFPEASKIQQSQLGNDLRLTDSNNAFWLFRKRQFSHCFCSDAILLNTMEGLGDIGVQYFKRKMGGKPVWMIGPACSSMKNDAYNQEERSEKLSSKTESCCEWLDLHPPASILSIGAFLSHCGWNSILESLSQGVPIIGWPLGGEQCFNSQMLGNEVGVCVEVARGYDSKTKHDEIARVIKMVLGKTEKGEEMRRKANQMKEKMEDALRGGGGFEGSSIKAINDFLGTATSIKKSSILK